MKEEREKTGWWQEVKKKKRGGRYVYGVCQEKIQVYPSGLVLIRHGNTSNPDTEC